MCSLKQPDSGSGHQFVPTRNPMQMFFGGHQHMAEALGDPRSGQTVSVALLSIQNQNPTVLVCFG